MSAIERGAGPLLLAASWLLLFACYGGPGGGVDRERDAGLAPVGEAGDRVREAAAGDAATEAGDAATEAGDAATEAGDGDEGLPPCAPPEEGSMDAGARDAGLLLIEAPRQAPVGLPFTVSVRAAGGEPLSAAANLCVDGMPVAELRLYRGRGSAPLELEHEGTFAIGVATGLASGVLEIDVRARAKKQVQGRLRGEALSWGREVDVVVSGELAVPEGSALVIDAGARVLFESKAAIAVSGTLLVRGTETAPVLFTRAGDDAWGGIRVLPGGLARLEHAWLTAGGGDGAFAFGHSDSQPVLFVREGELVMRGGGVVDNIGKAFGASNARVTLDGVLVSRCDTGGQMDESEVLIQNAHLLEMPDADGRNDDDDNDGIYLAGAALKGDGSPIQSVIRDTVFAVGEDDGIDHNGAELLVERVLIDGFFHEGIAGSNGRRLLVRDSVVRGCQQGIEAGYGSPEVVVEHCLLTDNDVGLRFGDSYDRETTGTLTVSHTIAVANRDANVRNHVNSLGGPLEGAIGITCSMVDTPGFDGQDANLPGEPTGPWSSRSCATGPVLDGAACQSAIAGPSLCF